MGWPTTEHFIFIPSVLLIGIVIGWSMGMKAAHQKMAEKAKRARE